MEKMRMRMGNRGRGEERNGLDWIGLSSEVLCEMDENTQDRDRDRKKKERIDTNALFCRSPLCRSHAVSLSGCNVSQFHFHSISLFGIGAE